jgi:uracil-DNA glycosylase
MTEQTNNLRDSIYSSLQEYYVRSGIAAKVQKCEHFSKCQSISSPRILTCGAEAHLGSYYGLHIKTVVVSLDTGEEYAYSLDTRTETMETISYFCKKTCQQTKGTFELLVDLYQDSNIDYSNVFRYVAMTNSAKCSGSGNKNKLKTSIYRNCSTHHKIEIELLKPDVVFTQGVDSKRFLTNTKYEDIGIIGKYLSNNDLDNEQIQQIENSLKNYIKRININNQWVLFINTPHPSARNGSWQQYKANNMTIVNKYIRYLYKTNQVVV